MPACRCSCRRSLKPPVPGKKTGKKRRRTRSSGKAVPTSELEINGVSVKIAKGADAKTIPAVIGGLKVGA